MMQQKPSAPSLIDNLGDGYRALNRRPLLVLLPIAINLYLWFGTQISFAPLVSDFASFVERTQPVEAARDQNTIETLTAFSQLDMRQPLAVLNSVPTLPVAQIVGLMGNTSEAIQVRSIWIALLIVVAINIVALPLTAGFLTRMADAVRSERRPWGVSLRFSVRVGLSIVGVVAILAVVGAALLLPFFVFTAVLMAVNQAIGIFALSLMVLAVFWVQIYLGFATEAIAMNGLNPLRALHASFNIVRRNFWGTLGFIGISYIISTGGAVIWRMLVGTTVGLIIAIISSAYIGCGLQAARMLFFQERLQRWQKPQQPS
jgi:hypothetical protein